MADLSRRRPFHFAISQSVFLFAAPLLGRSSTMTWKSISWILDHSSNSLRVYRSPLLVAILCVGVCCFDVDKCQGQISSSDIETILSTAGAGQADDIDDSRAANAQFFEFERQLNAMLKTRRDEEKEFIGLVVNQIRLGRIPSRLVSTSFEWVRNKRPTTKYPFVYFERVLRLQAGRVGLENEIPPFDFSIYSETNVTQSNASREAGVSPRSNNASTERRNSILRFGSSLLDRIRR